MSILKILVAEDDKINARLLERILTKQEYAVVVAGDGKEALRQFERQRFDVLVTDWMMPEMDGIELIRHVRKSATAAPLIIMITAIDNPAARAHALESGADAFIAKPFSSVDLLRAIKDGMARLSQPAPSAIQVAARSTVVPPFVGIAIAASTGGPSVLIEVLQKLSGPVLSQATFFVVQHAPDWMLESFVLRLKKESSLVVALAGEGMTAEPRHLYLAPGDRHMVVRPGTLKLKLSDSPPENFVRPAADPLFGSVAAAFGRYTVAAVMTGMGRDGTRGAAEVHAAGGVVLAQDPATAMAVSMPQTVIEARLATRTAPPSEMGPLIIREAGRLSSELSRESKAPARG